MNLYYRIRLYVKENMPVFLAALSVSLLVLYGFWGEGLTNPDGILASYFYNAGNWEIQLGRYGLILFNYLHQGLVSGSIMPIVAISVFILGGIGIAELFDVKDTIIKFFIILTTANAPFVCLTITYPYCSDAYAGGFAVAVFAVLSATHGGKKGVFFGTLLLAFGISIYQVNLGVAMVCCIFFLIFKVARGKDIQKDIFSLGAMVLGGGLIYYIILRIILYLTGLKLAAYKGADQFSLSKVFFSLTTSIPQSFQVFYNYYFGKSIMVNFYGTSPIYLLFFLFFIVVIIIEILFLKDKLWKTIVIGLLIVCIPLGCNIITIAIPNTEIGLNMVGSMSIVPALIIAGTIGFTEINGKLVYFKKIIKGVSYFLSILLIWSLTLTNNTDAVELKRQRDQTVFLANRVYSQLEERHLIGNQEIKIMMVGRPNDGNYTAEDHLIQQANSYVKYGVIWNNYSGSAWGWKNIYSMYLGDNSINWCNDEEYQAIMQDSVFLEAPLYPAEGSVLQIGDVLVFKFAQY